jgi:hypothetical protein
VLAAWGITTGGKPRFVDLAPGAGKHRALYPAAAKILLADRAG